MGNIFNWEERKQEKRREMLRQAQQPRKREEKADA